MLSFFGKVRDFAASRVREFASDEGGSIAILVGVMILTMMIVSGVAIDFARAQNTKESLQQDLDAALLFAGNERMQKGADYNIVEGAQQYMDGLARQQLVHGLATVTINQPSPTLIQAIARTKIRCTIMQIFGYNELDVATSSEVALGQQPIEVSLVLDNTGSMAGAKMAALKDAAKSLVDIAYKAPEASSHVKIGIVPFARYVNVGLSNRNQNWISVPPDATTTGPQSCSTVTPVTGQSNCRDQTGTYFSDGVSTTYTYQTCDYTYGPPVQQCTTPTSSTTWYGCVGSRNYPLDTLDEQYSTKEKGISNVGCPSEITPLINDQAALKARVDEMNPADETFIPTGLMWGWRVLSKDAPYAEGMDPATTVDGQRVRKVMVLMTDGQNTLSPTYPSHDGNDATLANKLTAEVCQNIKAAGIEIYTVAFSVTDDKIKGILQSCASAANKYFDATDAEKLKMSFNDIAKDFSPLRVTR